MTVLVQQNVLQLDVPVHNAQGVQVTDSQGHLTHVELSLLLREGANTVEVGEHLSTTDVI